MTAIMAASPVSVAYEAASVHAACADGGSEGGAEGGSMHRPEGRSSSEGIWPLAAAKCSSFSSAASLPRPARALERYGQASSRAPRR